MTDETAPSLRRFDVAVVGAGPAGLAAAVLFARIGFSTALIAPPSRPDDVRTTALLGGSMTFLAALGLAEKVEAAGAELATMRLVDATDRPIRAPEAVFHAAEVGLASFGVNIANADLTTILDEAVAALPGLSRIEEAVTSARPLPDRIELTTAGGTTIAAKLAIAADGKRSILREAAGIDTGTWALSQAALVLNLSHERPHDNASVEFHGRAGPFVLVPLPGGNRSSVVLIETTEEAKRLAALSDAALSSELERRSCGEYGKIAVEPGRQVWPLASLIAKSYGDNRVALVGETAHTLPPIGAQGLNLTLRDVAALGEIVAEAAIEGRDVGSATVLAAYERARRLDVEVRTRGVDLANRALLSDLVPVQAVRALGFFLAGRVGPIRRMVMREGLTPSLVAPGMMRGRGIPVVRTRR